MDSVFLQKCQGFLQKYKYVLLYGAGGVAEDLLCLLEPCLSQSDICRNLSCKERIYVVVTEKREGQDFLKGYAVKEISEFCDICGEVYIIISAMPRYALQMENYLKGLGFQNYCMVSALIDEMYGEIWTNPVLKNKIVFSNGDGYGFGGNPKYIALELLKREKNLELVWLTNNCNIELPDGMRAVKYGSYEHYYELGTAQVWIDNQHKNYFTRKRKEQFYLQTWHGGGPLKKIEFDAEGLSLSYLDLCEMNSGMENVMVSPTRFNSRLYREAFHYYGEVMECGYPRNDIFWKANESRKKVERLYQVKEEEGIMLFAPTYRGRERECSQIKNDILNLAEIQRALEYKFEKKIKIFVRFHPYDKNPEKRYPWCEEWINVTAYDDVQELLAASDILLTDYSSVMWDFSLQKKPVFLYHSDLNRYEKERGYYRSFDQMPYVEAFSNEEMCKRIEEFDEEYYQKRLNEFLEEYGSFDRGNASKVIADRIIEKIK